MHIVALCCSIWYKNLIFLNLADAVLVQSSYKLKDTYYGFLPVKNSAIFLRIIDIIAAILLYFFFHSFCYYFALKFGYHFLWVSSSVTVLYSRVWVITSMQILNFQVSLHRYIDTIGFYTKMPTTCDYVEC